MRCWVSSGFAILLLGVPVFSAHAQNAKVFHASSAWALDYGEDYCRLMRDFSSGDETVGLFVERTHPGPVMRLIVIGDAVRLFRGAQEIGYRLHPSGSQRMVQRLRFQTSDGQQYLNLGPTALAEMPAPVPGAGPVPPPPYSAQAEMELARQITGIALERGLTSPVTIETGEMGEAIGALQSCADDLLSSWGVDAERHKALSRPVMPAQPTAGWVANGTIAFDDFAKLAGGNNELRVMVDKTGVATSCHVHWPTLSEPANRRICASSMEKSTFMPALDQSGEAVDSYWTTSIYFLLPPFG